MRKVKSYKGFIIAMDQEGILNLFTKDEWRMGDGFRYSEFEAGTMQEALDFIDSY